MVDYKDRQYYNEKQKLEFLEFSQVDTSESMVNELGAILSSLKQYEEDYESDLCDFNLSCVKTTLALISKKSIMINCKILNYILKYVNWCIANGRCRYGNESKWHIVSLEDIDLSYVANIQLPKSPEILQEKLDVVYKLADDTSTSSEMAWFYKSAFYLAYLGLTEEEITLLKRSEIDLDNRTIKTNGKIILLDDYIIPYLERIMELDSVSVLIRGDMLANKKLIDTPYLIRRSTSGKPAVAENVSVAWLRWNASNFNKQYRKLTDEAIAYTMPRLYDAGVYYKLYQMEKSGINIDLNVVAELYSERSMTMQYGRIRDYTAWKKVYYA